MSLNKTSIKLPLHTQVIIGFVLGILFGFFFGEESSIFAPIGTAYTMLMEVVVYPYIICTLLVSLGSLTPELTKKLFTKGCVVYLLLIILIFSTLIILAQSIPVHLVFSASKSVEHNLILSYIIPQNLINAVSQDYVPAVIIFSVLFGLVLQFTPNNQTLFNLLSIISTTCLLFWKKLINLAPYATFALLADLVGNIKLAQINALSEFLILFIIGTLSLIFWIIPITISSLTNIKFKSVFYHLYDALIISAVTTLSVVAIPFIEKETKNLLAAKREVLNEQRKEEITQTVLLVGYPFAQLGNFFIYLFILFSALYFNQSIAHQQYMYLPILSFLSSIGSPSSSIEAVSFLSQWLNLPPETVNLYIALIPIIRYPQVLLSVMGLSFISIVISFVYYGYLKINFKKIFFHYLIFFISISILVTFLHHVFPKPGEKVYDRLYASSIEPSFTQHIKTILAPKFDESKVVAVHNNEDTLYRIQRSGVLRVGINPYIAPFSFYNSKNQLVGYDISYAYALADALHCNIIEFVPFTWPYLVTDMLGDKFDIAMSGIYVSEDRLTEVSFSTPYFHAPLSMIVPQEEQDEFLSGNEIAQIPNLKIGVLNDPILIPILHQNFPNAHAVILENLENQIPAQAFKEHAVNALMWDTAQTNIWVLNHPDYVSVVPQNVAAPFLMAYMIPKNSPRFLSFVDYWLEIKKNDGFQDGMYKKWILIR